MSDEPVDPRPLLLLIENMRTARYFVAEMPLAVRAELEGACEAMLAELRIVADRDRVRRH